MQVGGLLRTAQHVVDQRAIDVGAVEAESIEEGFVVRHALVTTLLIGPMNHTRLSFSFFSFPRYAAMPSTTS